MTRNPSTAEEFDDWADASEGRLASRAALLKPRSAKPNRGTLALAFELADQMATSPRGSVTSRPSSWRRSRSYLTESRRSRRRSGRPSHSPL